jgi:hypothetical protein
VTRRLYPVVAATMFAACGARPMTGGAPTPVTQSVVVPAAPATEDVETTATVGGVRFVFRAGRMTNFLEQLDCLAELIVCSREAFNSVWQIDAGDKLALTVWHDLRAHYGGQIDAGLEPEAEPVLPLAYHPRDIESALRVAGFGARDTADYLSRLSVFATTADVDAARGVLARFEARADERWHGHRAELVTSLDGYVALAQRDDVKAIAGDAAHFYSVDPAAARETFELVWRPKHDSPTTAQQLGELAVVEAQSGEPPTGQWPVVAHEMFHAWFSSAPIDKQVALVERFVASNDPLAQPAYAILDEVLATAFGNGLVARAVDRADYDRRAARAQGFYNDPYIDGVAKALLPALEKRLAAHGTAFDPDFVAEYLAAAHAAFPNGLPPIAYLRPLEFLFEPALKLATDHLRELVNANYTDGGDLGSADAIALRAKHRAWGTALVVTKPYLQKLAGLVDATTLAALKKQTAPAFVYAQRRTPIGVTFVFVAADDAAMTKLIDQFAALTTLRDGVITP